MINILLFLLRQNTASNCVNKIPFFMKEEMVTLVSRPDTTHRAGSNLYLDPPVSSQIHREWRAINTTVFLEYCTRGNSLTH